MNQKFVQKLDCLAEMASKSKAMQELVELDASEWAGIFASLSEKELDEYLFFFNEEKESYLGIEAKKKRRHKVNDTRRLQRLERLKIRMEDITKQIDNE